MAIWKARVAEADLASTSAQRIVGGELLTKIDCWINKVKANHLNRSFEDKYSIRAAASYNYIMACDIVPQDIYTKVHVYELDEIIRTWHTNKKKGLRIEVVVTLTKTPPPALEYASPYTSGIALPGSTQMSAYLLNILNQGASNIPKKKGNISATVAQRLALPESILAEVLSGNLAPLVAFQWPCSVKICINSGGTCWVNGNLELPYSYHPVNHLAIRAWGNQIKDSKATEEEPPAAIAVRLLVKNGAVGGVGRGGWRVHRPGGYFQLGVNDYGYYPT